LVKRQLDPILAATLRTRRLPTRIVTVTLPAQLRPWVRVKRPLTVTLSCRARLR